MNALYAVLAQTRELNNDTVSPGLLGLGTVVALGLALWLLMRSMSRHLRKVDRAAQPRPPDAGPGRQEEVPRDDGPGAA